jgi:hypothetical protein
MAFDIVIGRDAQPTTGFDVVIGSSDIESTMLDFDVPAANVGDILLILVVRDDAVACSDGTWTKIIDGLGAGGIFLDVYKRDVDGTAGSLEGDVISFLPVSLVSQELTGSLVVVENGIPLAPIEAFSHGAFLEDPNPTLPNIDSTLALNVVIGIWLADSTLTFAAPLDFAEVDTYSSSVVASRTLLVAKRTANVVGDLEPAVASASEPATGRAFALVLTYVPLPVVTRGSGHARRHHDADITNQSGHARRIHPTDVTNPSGHARKT